ncbi:mucin-like protein isoform X2 [Ruditapes philippinarum]|uniref:mucin-like protein isoform X2 n=1 Tax=Ruditapes philippinarum TaxID=129788 RepID=UPI00295BB619|nr:mucin-like protein isoform X2 [Ruditapes philippinarum]
MVNMYNCTCIPGYNGTNCEHDINDCVGEKCFNNGTCIDQVNNFTCTCTTGWKGHDCSKNIDECKEKTHKCNRNANCTDTEGGYNCTCWEGFTGNGYMCDDIDECVSNSTVCFNNATCVNTPGDHRCVCAPGWTGDTCFVDIDECNVTSACAKNTNCTNTNGSYTCKCKDGYRGDGYHKCIEEVLIAVDNVGHTESGDDEIFGPYHVNKSLSLFGRMYNKFYVSINGYITLGNVINETYPPATSSGWDRFEVPIIAPLWADIEIHGTNSDVEITNELNGKDLENIAKHLQVNSLRTGIVVTWKRAVPYPYSQNANFEAADFQVVIGATESNTYMMFNYDQEIFTWRTFSDRIVAAGYYFNHKNKLMTLDSNNFTSANMMNYDSSIKGRWIFNATSPSVEWKAKLACLAAVNTLETNVESSEPCPCSEAQAMRDTRFKFEGKKTIKGITVQQYVPRFKQPNERRQLCHYSSQYGSLIKGYPGGGYLETVNVTNAYKLCCNNSENISCNVFYQTSPSDNCSSYLPPTWSLSWGDPHFTTLDGKNYTFNGRGEYTLLSLDDASQSVKVQVRTEHIDDRKSATIFTGLAAQEVGKTKIELLLMNRTLKTANLYINNVLNTTFSSSKVLNLDFDDGSITSSNATISIIFKSGLTIRVGVSDILSIVLSVPKDEPFKGKTSGLLGNNNGISTDDFIKKNGTVLPADSNETTLYSFGQSWMLTKNESLFGYYNSSTSGRNFTFFNDPAKARPVTFIADAANFTDILITNCNKTHGLNLTHCKGNKACIVDTIGSCQKDFGEMSLDTEENAIKEKELIDNMPPNLEIPNELYVGYSKNTSVELKFKQQSVVQVTCKTNIESKSYKCDNTMFSWNVSQSLRNSMVDLTIMAKDSLNAYSEYQPNIYYCGCEKADQCDYSLIQIDGPVNDNFFRARCVCPETQNGTYCEKKVNICDRNPCFENVTCNGTLDNPCGPCPAGLTGDGVKCYDIDECRTNQSNCGQLCNNTIGGYTCSCRKGYEVDGNTCKDIDECSSNSSYCDSRQNKYCVNTIGSADCLCMPGFTENGGKCVNVKEKHSYGGVLVFEATPSVTKEDLKKPMIDYLTSIFSTSGSVSTPGSVYFVELVSFIVLPSSRKKRDTSSFNKYEMDYIVHMNQLVPTENLTASLDNTFNNLGQENGFVSPKIPGLNAVVKISTKDSKIFSDKDGGICNMPGSVTCDDISTKCVSANGDYSCICREGFSGWANPYTSCKDIDECSPKPSTVCIGGKNCTNYPGSYLCHCEPGFRYEKPNCVDMCDSSPCQNGGQCIHGNTEGMYLCKCDDKWTGPTCENENSEAEKLKIIAIAVGASVGGVCLFLLCGLCGMYRRYRNRYSGYRRRPLSSMDFDSSLGLAGTNIRTKDFPIDDDTDTAFSIPRPKYNENEYDMLRTNASSLNETSGKDTGKYNYAYQDDNGTFF